MEHCDGLFIQTNCPRSVRRSVRPVLARASVLLDDEPHSMSDTPVSFRARRAAERTGHELAEIERLPFDLSALEADGIFCNVDARNFGLLDRRLDWRALGISLPRTGDLAFRPPRCGLVPDRYRLPLLRPAARVHSALHKFSYQFRLVETVFETSEYRWIPWRAWSEFEHEFDAAQARLRGALQAYETNFESIRQTVLETFEQLGTDSARRLEATGHPVPPDFVDAVVHEVLATLPTPALLWECLSLRYRVGVMQLGSEMLGEQRKAAEERRLLDVIEAEHRLEQRRQQAEEHVVQQNLWVEQERIRLQLRAEAEERKREAAVKERLRQLKLEAARERLHDVLSPLEEGAAQLHAAVFEAANALRDSLQKHQALRGSSARKARDLARWFRAMNWQGEAQLEALVLDLEQLASAPTSKKRKRDPGPLNQVLGDIIALTYADASALAEPSRMAALEI